MSGQRAYSFYDLVFAFLERFYDEAPPESEKKRVASEMWHLLLNGWTAEDITNELRMFRGSFPGVRPDLAELFEHLRRRQQNLLRPDRFYFHNQLRIMPGPPKRSLDLNAGTITKNEEEHFLEMRASYTVEDLTDYYIQQSKESVTANDRKRMVGAFKYLLKTHELEVVLFMVDAGVNAVYSEDLGRDQLSPLKLADYKGAAEMQFAEKRTENIRAGDDCVVPRRRVLSLRGSDPVGQPVPTELHADAGQLQDI